MARARRTGTTSAKPKGQTQTTGEYTCPECGRTFTRAAALGSHRRTHGVAGATAKRPNRPSSPTQPRSAAARTPATRKTGTTGGRRGRPPTRARQQIDRDALLQTLFPNGVPAREAVWQAANEWLDLADQLANMK